MLRGKRHWTAGLLMLSMLVGCGGPSNLTHANSGQSSANTAASENSADVSSNSSTNGTSALSEDHASLAVHTLGSLTRGVLGNALCSDGAGSVWSVGGYTGSQSIRDVASILPHAQTFAALPVPTHDAATGVIGRDIYVFGGGQSDSYNSVLQIRQGQAQQIGRLTTPLSDASCVEYTWHGQKGLVLLGGYDGHTFQRQVRFVAQSSGKLTWSVLTTLPIGVRYTALATDGTAIYVVGGQTSAGPTAQVQRWSPDTGWKSFASLPSPVEKAAAFWLQGQLVVAGGLNRQGNPTSTIYGVQSSGVVDKLGNLPVPLADFGYVQDGSRGIIAGGMTTSSSSAHLSAKIYEINFE